MTKRYNKYDNNNNNKNKNNTKRKTRRSNKNKNRFKNFCVYYNNIRGINSKITSLKDIVDEINPHIICLNETHLDQNENIEIDNYEFVNNNNKKGKGGVSIGVRKDILHLCSELSRKTKEYEMLWMKISNNKNINIRIGNIYAPQENKTKKKTIEEMYDQIANNKIEAEKANESFLLMGDFNCKIGNKINNNKEEISEFGPILLKTVKEQEMIIINANNKCKGMWTRIEGNKKSVIDYVLTGEENENNIKEMIIDENKVNTPFHIVNKRTIYSDHCSIILKMNWYIKGKIEDEKYGMKINKKTLQKFHEMTNGKRLTNIIKKNDKIDKKYKEWQEEVSKIIVKCFKRKKINNKQKPRRIKNLYKLKRKIKKGYLTESKSKTKVNKYKIQNELIKEYILKEEAKVRAKNVKTEINKLEKEGGINSNAFWEFRKRVDKKWKQKEIPCGMTNNKGEIVTNRNEIREVYKEFYTELFKVKNEDNEEAQMDEIIFNTIKTIANTINEKERRDSNMTNEIRATIDRTRKADEKEIAININKMKNKVTMDVQGWNNNILKNSGTDIITSLQIIIKEIEQQQRIPKEWDEIIIKSIYKNKGKRNDMENRRGLFITSVISKLYEKIKLTRNNAIINNGISKYQCGGSQGKSTIDHIMTLNEIINYNKYINKETYVLFADAYKCFDKLKLKNCIIDLYKIVGAKEAMNVYRLNKIGNATIDTPFGKVGPIKANNIVRQGTIIGPKLCCINTDKINNIGRKCITSIGPNIKVEMLTYVDDINFASSNVEQIKKAVANLRCMERCKGFTFNTGKNKTEIMIINKRKNKEYCNNIKLSVKSGEIEITKEYKYLGEWYNEKGNHATSIKKKKEKINYYIKQIKIYGNERVIGKYAMLTRIKIYKTIVIPTIYHNVEAWSNINKTEMKELEEIQGIILRKICEQRKTTPYIGLLAELGIWTVEKQIEYKKIMLLHNILTSKYDRLIKEIIKDQIQTTWPGCWIEKVKQLCNKYSLNIDEIHTYTKNNLKQLLKGKINTKLNVEICELSKQKTKVRFIKEYSQKEYLKELKFKDCIMMIKIRLNMIETKCNYKSMFTNLKCEICKSEDDTTEHLLECTNNNSDQSNKEKLIEPNNEIVKIIAQNISTRESLGYRIKVCIQEE